MMNSYIVTVGLFVLCAVLITAEEKQEWNGVADSLASLSDDTKLEIFNDAVEEVLKSKSDEFEDEEEVMIDKVSVKLDARPAWRRRW